MRFRSIATRQPKFWAKEKQTSRKIRACICNRCLQGAFKGGEAVSDICNVNRVLCQQIRGWGVKMEVQGRLGTGWQGIHQAIAIVVPRVSSRAPSSNSGVVQVQSCLSRRQGAPAVPGCRGRLDNGVS